MVNAQTTVCFYSFVEGSSLDFFCVSWKCSSRGRELRKQKEKHSLVLHEWKFQKGKSQSFYHDNILWPWRNMKWQPFLPVLKHQACKWAPGTAHEHRVTGLICKAPGPCSKFCHQSLSIWSQFPGLFTCGRTYGLTPQCGADLTWARVTLYCSY